MTKYEFIQTLRTVLSIELNHSLVNDNVKFYEEYIDMEIRKGRNEEDVLKELGDPRLIAKTIIDTNKVSGESVVDEQREETREDGVRKNVFKVPAWFILVMIIAIVILVFGVLTSLISFIFPILMPILMIGFILRIFTSNRR